MGIQLTIKYMQLSIIEKKANTTQYVSHCVSSPGFAESIALKEAYAGYKNVTKSETSLIPPRTNSSPLRTESPAKKKYTLEYPVLISSSFNLSFYKALSSETKQTKYLLRMFSIKSGSSCLSQKSE